MLYLRDMGQDIIGPFKSQQKSSFLKEVYMNMETSMKMKPNRDLIGHLKLYKKSKIISKY